MSNQAMRAHAPAHVVVLGNEKGGSGKSTTAMHIAVALMHVGQRVATIDLDSRQRSLTRYIEHRRAWARHAGVELSVPTHRLRGAGSRRAGRRERSAGIHQLRGRDRRVERSHDFVVDRYAGRRQLPRPSCPLHGRYADHSAQRQLRRSGRHRHVDPTTFAVTGESHYAAMVRDARRQRRAIDGARLDWVVVRNRLSIMGSRNKRLVGEGLQCAGRATRISLRDGLAERLVYREFFPRGLTASTDGCVRPGHPPKVADVDGTLGDDASARSARSCRSIHEVSAGRRRAPSGSPRRNDRSRCTI